VSRKRIDKVVSWVTVMWVVTTVLLVLNVWTPVQ
jgi:hypothetical protein